MFDICEAVPHCHRMRVLDTFDVHGRGVIVSTDEVIEFPFGAPVTGNAQAVLSGRDGVGS